MCKNHEDRIRDHERYYEVDENLDNFQKFS